MKKLIASLMCLLLTLVCLPVCAMHAPAEDALSNIPVPMEEGLSVYPTEMDLPMFSANFSERIWVFYDGEEQPANLFSWSSSNTRVLTVDQNGYITPVAPGTAVVTVSDDEDTAQCVVTVVADDDFTRLQDLEFTHINLPYYNSAVGIGPLCGGEAVIMKRFIFTPSCSDDNCPDPNDLLPETGWVYTYAVVFRFMAHTEHSYVFSASMADGADAAQSAYVLVFDQFFNLWAYSKGTSANPFGTVSFTSYEDSYFYVVITPITHTANGASGYVNFSAYDAAQPDPPENVLGDADCSGEVNFADISCMYLCLIGAEDFTQQGALNADFDGDGIVGFGDVSALYMSMIN